MNTNTVPDALCEIAPTGTGSIRTAADRPTGPAHVDVRTAVAHRQHRRFRAAATAAPPL